MFTTTQIDGMTGDTLQRAIAKILDAGLVDQQDTNQKYEDSLGVAQAADNRVGLALERIAGAAETSAAAVQDYLQPKQRLWVELYQTHLKARKDPAIVTSATGDAIVKDIVLDAVMMTNEVFGPVKAAMASLQIPPGGVDWT